jgi:hypothetical protein
VIRAILFGAFVFFVATFPATWLLMLFLGNLDLHQHLGYWAVLPLGVVVSMLLGGVSGRLGTRVA